MGWKRKGHLIHLVTLSSRHLGIRRIVKRRKKEGEAEEAEEAEAEEAEGGQDVGPAVRAESWS